MLLLVDHISHNNSHGFPYSRSEWSLWLLLNFFYLVGHPYYLWSGKLCTWGCCKRLKQGWWEWFIQTEMIFCPYSLEIAENIRITFVEENLLVGCLIFLFISSPLIFSSVLIHYLSLCYFCSRDLYYWIQMRVLPVGNVFFITCQYHPVLIQYLHLIFLHILKGGLLSCLKLLYSLY